MPIKGNRGSWGGVHRTGVAVIAAAIRARERRIAQRTGVIRTRVKLLEDGGEADRWATGGRGGPRSRDGRAGLSCAEQRRGRHGGEEGSVLWGRGVSERGKREERCGLSALRDAGRSGAGRGARVEGVGRAG